jgi:hypothetical protein
VAGHDDHEHPDGQDQDVRVLQDDVRQVARAQEVGVERGEQGDDRDERDHDAALAHVPGDGLPDRVDDVHET